MSHDRDGRSVGLVTGDGTLGFAATNRGPGTVRLAALGVEADGWASVPEGPDGQRFEVWVGARRPARAGVDAASLPAALPLDEPASVGPGETATVRVFGFRDGGAGRASDRDAGVTVTLYTGGDGQRYEATVHLTH